MIRIVRRSVLVLMLAYLLALLTASNTQESGFYPLALLIAGFIGIGVAYTSLKSNASLVGPIIMVFLSFVLGVLVRGVWLLNSGTLQSEVSYGFEYNELVSGVFLALIGFILFSIGSRSNMTFECNQKNEVVSIRSIRLALLVGITILIWLYAVDVLMTKIGLEELSLNSISDKRKVYDSNGQRYSFGYLRVLLRIPGYLFIYLVILSSAKQHQRSFLMNISKILLFLLVIFTGVFTSSRTDIFNVMFVWFIMRVIYQRLALRQIIYAGGLVVTLSLVIISSRGGNAGSGATAISMLDGLVGNNNLYGLVKSTAVFESIAEKNSYKYGSTLVSWMAAPIPREIWKDKPIINPGLVFRNEVMPIYSINNDGGIPPSFVVELFWNFGVIGLLLSFFWGLYEGRTFRKLLKSIVDGDVSRIVFLMFFYYTLTFRLSGESFTQLILFSIESYITVKFIDIFNFFRHENIAHN